MVDKKPNSLRGGIDAPLGAVSDGPVISRHDRALKTAIEIAELKEQLAQREAFFIALVSGTAAVATTLTERIADELEREPHRAFTAAELVLRLGADAALRSVRTLLLRLVEIGRARRVAPGQYRAASSSSERGKTAGAQ